MQLAASVLGVDLMVLNASSTSEIEAAFLTLVQRHAGALLIGGDVFFVSRTDQLVALAARHAVPVMYTYIEQTLAGGLIAYGWAFRHPACVDRIAGMSPAIDFRSYPTLPNVVALPTKGLDYGLSLEELDRRAGEFNPIDNLAPLAKAGAKILHLHGDEDKVVPTSANAIALARRYRELGGEAEIVLLKDLPAAKRGHDGPELYESERLLKFLLAD